MKTRTTYRGYWYEVVAVGSGRISVWQCEITIGKHEEDGSEMRVLPEHIVPGEFEGIREAIVAAGDFARRYIDRLGADGVGCADLDRRGVADAP
jgi:hypothetical protein